MPTAKNAEIDIHYEVHGPKAAPPVLLIMGLGGSLEYWNPQVEGLQDTYRLLRFDNRGVGKSSRPKEPWKMAHMAADALAVLDAEGVEAAHVVGVSMGGMIAQHVALGYPDRVKKLALCATTPGLFYAPAAPDILALMTQVEGKSPEEIARDNLRLLFTPETIAARPDYMEEVVALSMRLAPPRRGFQNQTLAVMGHDTRKRLPEIRHPTLVLTGDRDELVPPKNSHILTAEIPGARLITLPGAAHGLLMDRAEECNQILREWLG